MRLICAGEMVCPARWRFVETTLQGRLAPGRSSRDTEPNLVTQEDRTPDLCIANAALSQLS